MFYLDKRLMKTLSATLLPVVLMVGAAHAEPDEPKDFLSPINTFLSAPSSLTSLGSAPVSENALDHQRGGTNTMNDMDLDGVVGNNHASNLVTGQNMVTDGSLTGNAGLTTVVQNSGNNVLVQNATIVNLQVQ